MRPIAIVPGRRWQQKATPAALLAVLSVAACSPGIATSGQTASPAASPAKPSVTSTLDGYTTLPQRISWVATPGVPPPDVSEVDFLIDGKRPATGHLTLAAAAAPLLNRACKPGPTRPRKVA